MVISRDINKVRSVTEKRIADRKKAFNKKKSGSSSSNNEEKEFITIKNNKVVVVNSKGETLRNTLTIQEKQLADKSKIKEQYIANIKQQSADKQRVKQIESKINKGSATNKEYVDYLNISTRYGGDFNKVKEAITIGAENKRIKEEPAITKKIYTRQEERKNPQEFGGGVISEVPKKNFQQGITDKLMRLEQSGQDQDNVYKRMGAFIGSAAKSVVIDYPIGIANLLYQTVTLPATALSNTAEVVSIGPSAFAENKRSQFKNTIFNVKQSASSSILNYPAVASGWFGGQVFAPFVWSESIAAAQNVLTRIGKTEIPASRLFSEKSLETGSLPKTSSTQESLNRFRNAIVEADKYDDIVVEGAGYTKVTPDNKLVVAHSTTANLGKTGTLQAGPKGAAGLEDPLTYVTSSGDSSPIRILDNSAPEYKFSLNPFEMFKNNMGKVYEWKVLTASKVPKNVLLKAGFGDDLANYYNSIDDATVFITKRSTLGQGEIPRQSFTVSKEFDNPVASLTVNREGQFLKLSEGQKVKVGDIIKESLTSEFEGGITNLPYKNTVGNKYAVVNGKTILLREGEILSKPSSTSSAVAIDQTASITPISSGNTYTSSLSSSSNVRSVTPSFPIISSSSGSIPFTSSGSGILSSSGSSIVSSSSVSIPKSSMSSFSSSLQFSTPLSSGVSISKSFSKGSGSSSSPAISSSSGSGSSSITSIGSTSGGSSSGGSSSGSSSITSIGSTSGGSSSSSISTPSIKPPFIPSYKSQTSTSRRKETGYNVLVRRRGQFFRVNSRPLIKSQALQKGFFTVGNTAAATFKLERATGSLGSFRGRGFSQDFDFKLDKTTGGPVFMERRGKRIKSGGELREITYKGILASRGKRKKTSSSLTKNIAGL